MGFIKIKFELIWQWDLQEVGKYIQRKNAHSIFLSTIDIFYRNLIANHCQITENEVIWPLSSDSDLSCWIFSTYTTFEVKSVGNSGIPDTGLGKCQYHLISHNLRTWLFWWPIGYAVWKAILECECDVKSILRNKIQSPVAWKVNLSKYP